VAANSADSLDRLSAFSAATRSAVTSASILERLRAVSVAIYASTLDLLSAIYDAALEAASYASTLDLLSADSTSYEARYLYKSVGTVSSSRGSSMTLYGQQNIFIYEIKPISIKFI